MLNANRLTEIRKGLNLTQINVAKKVNVDRTTYSKYEKGKHQPSLETLCLIADYFDVSIDYLLGKADDPETTFKKKASSEEETSLLTLYRKACDDDKKIVRLILSKYDKV